MCITDFRRVICRYSLQAKITSERYRDQLKTPMETAIYWVEYIARHNGAPHLRSSSLQLSTICYYNIDVFLTITILLAFVIFCLMKLTPFDCKRVGRDVQKNKSE